MRTKRSLLAAAAVAFLGALIFLPAARGTTRMDWHFSPDSSALCNDFTRAGYFLQRNETSRDWVIFLESGSLCYSNDTCNRRFFLSEVRNRFSIDGGGFGPYGNFDPQTACEETSCRNNPQGVFNPLMSSMSCFRNRTDYFPPENGFTVLGTDILDQNNTKNPLFWTYNHVVIPYCSSDVWLGNEMAGTRVNTAAQTECSCFDYDCFNYRPNSENLQFTFRGKIIFESIITDLMNMGMGLDGSRVVLAGSSAGAVGVMNNIRYVKQALPSTTDVSVILDSAWFINFQGNIFREFDGTVSLSQSEARNENAVALLDIIESNEACNDTDLGFPCCISAYCLFTQTNSAGVRYYPDDVPTFAIFGLYDIFLLAPSLAGVVQIQDERTAVGYAIDFLRVVGEYGGDMNGTLAFTEPQTDFFSYYVTQCFQHIHFATSSLWGAEGASVFGRSSVELDRELASFTHEVRADVWRTRPLAGGITMSDAISAWYGTTSPDPTKPLRFRDSCTGPYCNMNCPEEFNLGSLTSNNWATVGKAAVAIVIVGVTILCLIMKLIFGLWLCRLNWKQNAYLDTLEKDLEEAEDQLQFPDCPNEEAISVACINLKYSVTFRAKKVKDEKKDHLTPLVLHNITPEGAIVEDGDDDDPLRTFSSSSRRRDSNLKPPPASERIRGFVQRTSAHFSSPTKDPEANILTHISTSSPPPEDPGKEELQKKRFGQRQKEILKGISIYFNPGEMVGIMGPSGCGKTTFLDLLTGRRKSGKFSGEIYINGMKMEDVRDWYVANTGYVLQLATPYYEELTVRENLTLAAAMKLSDMYTLREKFERVEQVMEVSGLTELADTIVGGATGPGLSGGQKRRLVIALQLLKLPNVIFLDEPTSGLDAASSFELLSHLNKLADSNRTIILTIHQPRLEIFHMFHRLVLLSDGKVAYHGVPEKAYEVFVNALKTRYLELGLIIPELEDHNPADVIMDMLGNPKMRKLITDYYQASCEPRLVTRAIKAAQWKEKSLSLNSLDNQSMHLVGYLIWGAKRPGQRHAGPFTRLAALEARASKRANLLQVSYLPVIFALYGIMLGTVYLQTSNPVLVISGYTVYSVASALFMFPVLYHYFFQALQVYTYERGDGVGRAHDLVIQGFIRGVATAAVPVVACAGALYVLLVNHNSYNFLAFIQVALVNMALNQTWTALLIAMICGFPGIAFRVSPIVASLAGFTSGFFIPIEQIPWWYRWMVYINPNYYGFSSSAFFLLSEFDSGCEGSQFECFTSSGEYILQQFNFNNINPYLHIVILLTFTVFYLFLASFANWVRHTTILQKLKRVGRTVMRLSSKDAMDQEPDEPEDDKQSYHSDTDTDTEGTPPIEDDKTPLAPFGRESQEVPAITPHTRAVLNWKVAASRSLDSLDENAPEEETTFTDPAPRDTESGEEVRPGVRKVRIKDPLERPSQLSLATNGTQAANGSAQPGKPPPKSLFLREGATHTVWKPKEKAAAPQLANVVTAMLRNKQAPRNLHQRQKTLAFRVLATQAVLREQNEELITGDLQPEQQRKHISLKEASKRILKKEKTQLNLPPAGGMHFTDIVSQFIDNDRKPHRSSRVQADGDSSPTKTPGEGSKHSSRPTLFKQSSQAAGILKRQRNSIRNANTTSPAVGAVPLKKWKNLVREHRKLQSEGDDITDGAAKSPVVKQAAVDVEGSSLWMKPERAPPQDRRSSLQRQGGTERLSVESASGSADSKTKEERLLQEIPESVEDMTRSRPSPVRTPSPSPPPSGDAADPKPDEKGLCVDDLQTSSGALAPVGKTRTVQIAVPASEGTPEHHPSRTWV